MSRAMLFNHDALPLLLIRTKLLQVNAEHGQVFAMKLKRRYIKQKTYTNVYVFVLETGIYISSQAVSSQVLSAQLSLTSVFGMRTGGTSASLTPVMV